MFHTFDPGRRGPLFFFLLFIIIFDARICFLHTPLTLDFTFWSSFFFASTAHFIY